MATEIERKFLVVDDSWRASVFRSTPYRQGYLAGGKSSSVRVRTSDSGAWLNIKGATLGVRRREYEYPIPQSDAEQMLAELCDGALIEKTRHFVEYEGKIWEVDVFEGDNEGLVVAEVELESETEPFARPSWVGEEVSNDTRYYNVCLASHPFKSWGQEARDG